MTSFDTTEADVIQCRLQPPLERAGRHTSRAALGYQHALTTSTRGIPAATSISSGAISRSLPRAGADDRGAYGYYAVNNRGIFGKAGANILSLYVQDQWQIADA